MVNFTKEDINKDKDIFLGKGSSAEVYLVKKNN